MARIRTIKPEYFDDEDVARTCCLGARLLFVGLWTQADKAGRLEDRPARLKARLFPYDADVSPKTVEEWLSQLAAGSFILRYQCDGRAFIQIRTFRKHQHVNVRESESTIPEPEENGGVPAKAGANTSHEPAKAGGDREGKGIGKGKEGNGDAHPPRTFPTTPLATSHRACASCGRVCVPGFLHAQLRTQLGGNEDEADTNLRRWYAEVLAKIPADQPIGDDPIKFWRLHFAAAFPSQAPQSPPKLTANQQAAAEARRRRGIAS